MVFGICGWDYIAELARRKILTWQVIEIYRYQPSFERSSVESPSLIDDCE
jgi:hypothetical protein